MSQIPGGAIFHPRPVSATAAGAHGVTPQYSYDVANGAVWQLQTAAFTRFLVLAPYSFPDPQNINQT